MQHLLRLAAVAALACASSARASDHADGPVTTADGVADLGDLYAFPTPDRPGALTVVVTPYPVVRRRGHFSDKVDYSVLLRRAEVRGGASPGFDTGDEVVIRCSFSTPHDRSPHRATCAAGAEVVASVEVGEVLPAAEGEALRLFAGPRCDPFYFNPDTAKAIAERGELPEPGDTNAIEDLNTLALVLEVDLGALFGDDPPTLVAVAAESTTRDGPDAPLRRLDRVGRPEITNVSLAPLNGTLDLRDAYNAEPTFAVPAAHLATYRERLAANLRAYDAVDGRADWDEAGREALAGLLLDDFLVVDPSRPCDGASFMEIERRVLAGQPHLSCGGRGLADDVMDVVYGLHIGGLGGDLVRDGVEASSCPADDRFPYLADPDRSLSGRIKTWLFNKSQR